MSGCRQAGGIRVRSSAHLSGRARAFRWSASFWPLCACSPARLEQPFRKIQLVRSPSSHRLGLMLEVRNLTVSFDRFRAVDDVSFSVRPESGITALLGPNGAGKTTTMRAITGALAPTSGQIMVDGIEAGTPEAQLAIKRRIGYLPETTPVYPEMLVSEFIEFSGRARGLRDHDLERAARNMVERLELGSHFYTPIGLLSKGFRQRVALAATLLHDPQVIILDEPTSGLDPNQIQSIRSLIRELGKNRTLILSTHILQEVDDICERAIIINRGRIVADRPVAELKSSNRHVLVARDAAVRGIDLTDALKATGLVQHVHIEEDPADKAGSAAADGWKRYVCSLSAPPERFFAAVRSQSWELREFAPVSRSLDEIFRELTVA